MAYDDPATQRRIDVSVGINNAAVLAAAYGDQATEVFSAIVGDVVAKVIFLQGENLIDAVFPGTTQAPSESFPVATVAPISAAPSYVQPAVAPQIQGYGPAPIPGAADGDPAVGALWQDLIANRNDWHDNRRDKRSAAGPDFRHKSRKNNPGDKYNVGLWLNDKKNPSWVPQALANAGI